MAHCHPFWPPAVLIELALLLYERDSLTLLPPYPCPAMNTYALAPDGEAPPGDPVAPGSPATPPTSGYQLYLMADESCVRVCLPAVPGRHLVLCLPLPALLGREMIAEPLPLAAVVQCEQSGLNCQSLEHHELAEAIGQAARRTAEQPPADPTGSSADGCLHERWLRGLYALLDAHLDKSDLSVEWLAAQLSMSRKTLLRKLQRLLQLGPRDVIQQYRLRRGAELLRAGYPVAQAAYAVGFNTPAYFGQCFKDLYHVTPRQFAGSGSN